MTCLSDKKIQILMATYNGGKYLNVQILSIIGQTHENWELLISDDGSTDDTLEIIEKFSKSDSRINILKDSHQINRGAGKRFIHLVKNSSCDYLMFCDQDDLWLEDKIEVMLTFAEKKFKKNKPCLAYSDGYLFYSEKNHIVDRKIAMPLANGLKDFIFHNGGYQGCSMIFNRDLADLIKKTNDDSWVYMHDHIVSLLAHSLGEVFYINRKLILYRQHSSNVTGNSKISRLGTLKHQLTNKIPFAVENHIKEKFFIHKEYNSLLSEKNKNIYENYLIATRSKKIHRTFLLIKNRFTLSGSFLKIIMRSLYKK